MENSHISDTNVVAVNGRVASADPLSSDHTWVKGVILEQTVSENLAKKKERVDSTFASTAFFPDRTHILAKSVRLGTLGSRLKDPVAVDKRNTLVPCMIYLEPCVFAFLTVFAMT